MSDKTTGLPQSEEDIVDLVTACGEGDEEKLKLFFEIYSQDIYNFPIKIFHLDRDSASDFYLYAFDRLRNGKRFRSFKGKSSFKTWFYSVLRNLVIDWMRTVKVLPTVSIRKVDSEGKEYQTIESEPDPHSSPDVKEVELLEKFQTGFHELKLESRVIFKLSFLYYLNLEVDEIDYIAEKSDMPAAEVTAKLLEIKDILSKKQIQNIESEDKLTSLYQSILELKMKRKKILDANPELNVDDPGALSGQPGNDAFHLEKIEASLQKKYQQREKLLEKKEKGHFLVRTPYKYISEMLDIPEGSLSVQLMRTLEKIKNSVENSIS